MKILEVKDLAIPDVKVVKFARFADSRGFFTEPFRRSDFDNPPEMKFLCGVPFLQVNESYSKPGVMRGLHFQWNPFMGKLLRTLTGRMYDMFCDIRKGSPTYGKIAIYDMPVDMERDYSEWIWVPPGFAHGNFFNEDSIIEYFCSGEYSPGCEASISPLSEDLDWSLCDKNIKSVFDEIISKDLKITDKDKFGYSLKAWTEDERSNNFIYGSC